MVALEEGLLDLDAEVRDGFTLRHLLSHCAGLPERPACAGGSRPAIRPVRSAGTRTPATCRRPGCSRAPSGMSCAAYLGEAVLSPLAMDASLGLAEADAARTARVWQPGRYGEGELFNSAALSQRRAAAGRRASRPRAPTARSSPACSRAAAPAAARCWRPRPSTRCWRRSSGRCRAGSEAWASGRISAGASASTCAGGASRTGRARRSVRARASHFGASGTLAWLDPERGLGLVALANRGTYSGWWREPWAALGAAVTAAAAAA